MHPFVGQTALSYCETSARNSRKLQTFSGKVASTVPFRSQAHHLVNQRCPLDSDGTHSTTCPLPTSPYSRSRPQCQLEALDNTLLVSLSPLLRRHINSRKPPIYRLHPELLSAVASHIESESDLVCATRISSRWRDALHSHSSLWAHLDFEYIGRALAFLKRSKSAALHVNLSGDGETSPSIEPLLPHTARIVTLGSVDRKDQKKLLSQPMPSLRRLEISDSFYDDDDSDDSDESDESGGSDDSNGSNDTVNVTASWSFPSVISLAVHNTYPIPFHVPRLTCFKFRFVHPTDDGAMLESLLDFLHDCPLLEDLEISYPEDFLSANDEVISLPNLRVYTQNMLPGYGAYSLGVFNMLSFPPSCAVTLRSWTNSDMGLGTANIIPPLKNPKYLAGIRRVKISMTLGSGFDPNVLGTLQLVNDQGSRVRLEREISEPVTYQRTSVQELMGDSLKFGLLNCLKDLDTRSIEILCIEADESWDEEVPAADAIEETLGQLGSIKTLVVSHTAVKPCLLALERGAADQNGQGFPQVQTLVFHSRSSHHPSGVDILRALLPISRRRKAVGHPFVSVSIFLRNAPNPGCFERQTEELTELRGCVGKFELVMGDDVLGWDIDRYFLDGFDHFRNRRNVQWELDDAEYLGR